MSRVPPTYANERREVRLSLAPNPNWTREQFDQARAGDLRPACHDGSPSVDVRCPTCSYTQHLHLSQFEAAPPGSEIAAVCKLCGTTALLDRDEAVAGLKAVFGLA